MRFALVLGSFADEVSGDDDTSLKESRCLFCTANLYLTLPLVSLLAFLLVRFAAERSSLTEQPFETIGALWLTGYLFALAGATVAHELTHRNNRFAKLSAYLLLGFTGNASFVDLPHLHASPAGRHLSRRRHGTAWRTLAHFHGAHAARSNLRKPRASRRHVCGARVCPHIPGETNSSWRISCRWQSWLSPGSSPAGRACWSFSLAGLIGRSFHELINYVQHYGLVRVENSPIRSHHSWDCYRTISNVLHYNLPRHSDHHMFANKAFWQLDTQQTAPTLPYGYQTMAFIALTPPLWRHIMRPLLADWDQRFASDAEREVVRERGWEGVA